MSNGALALLLVDVQVGLDDPGLGRRNNADAESRMADLLSAWREREWLVVHVQHCSTEPQSSLRPELPGNAIKPEVQPRADEVVFKKQVNSAFVGTDLQGYLQEHAIDQLVILGLTTDHCVSATTRSASDLGFEVTLVSDATATFERSAPDGTHFEAEQIHQVHLASLNGEFCQVRSTADILADLP